MTTDVVEVIDRGKKYWEEVAEKNLELQKKTQEILKQNNNTENNVENNQNKVKENSAYKSTTYNNNMNKISEKHNKKQEK